MMEVYRYFIRSALGDVLYHLYQVCGIIGPVETLYHHIEYYTCYWETREQCLIGELKNLVLERLRIEKLY